MSVSTEDPAESVTGSCPACLGPLYLLEPCEQCPADSPDHEYAATQGPPPPLGDSLAETEVRRREFDEAMTKTMEGL